MKLAFAGTPEFARVALAQLVDAGFEVALVLTQPDRPAGRGLRLQMSPVKTYALERGIACAQPRGLRIDGRFTEEALEARAALRAARPEAIVVAAYGLILPVWTLELPAHGCINIHASLLPRWRGAAPIHRAIDAGDVETGVTIMQMDEGLDTGPMLLSEALAIDPDATTATLQTQLAELGGSLVVRTLHALGAGGLDPRPQPAIGVTYARRVGKDEADIDWRLPAELIERRLRAFDPFPGASSGLGGETIKCWRGRVTEATDGSDGAPGSARSPRSPGSILAATAQGIRVACGVGALDLTLLQRPGGRRLSAREFLQRGPLAPGMHFGAPPL